MAGLVEDCGGLFPLAESVAAAMHAVSPGPHERPGGRPPSWIRHGYCKPWSNRQLCAAAARLGLHVPTRTRPDRPRFLIALLAGVRFGGAVVRARGWSRVRVRLGRIGAG